MTEGSIKLNDDLFDRLSTFVIIALLLVLVLRGCGSGTH